jgi:MFS family permease
VNSELAIWFVVNIFFPVIAPILLLLVPKLLKKTRPYAKGLVLKAVQDGQLFWLTVALSAVGAYELYVYAQVEADQSNKTAAWFVILLLLALWGISVVLGVLSALSIPEHLGKQVPQESATQNAPAKEPAAHTADKGKEAVSPQEHTTGQKAGPASVIVSEPDMGMVVTSAVFLFIASVIAIVAHHLAATTTQSAILAHEEEWKNYASCLMDRRLNVLCPPQPKGATK